MSTDERCDEEGKSTPAVAARGLYFYFDKKREHAILNDASITVKRGSIYSLLGPSGCGKTTLLKCIIGQYKPQAGSLKIYGRSPGSRGFFIPGRGVGYMPQELALYMEMSIDEILTYFGSIYGMDMQSIRERITFLIELLELPEKNRLIGHLSGGQQRRVSFAIALIHKPPLLILDEPTVGVDPLLRKTIWNHLVSLVKTNHLTIIITTHYTEEARQAHIVGLMRSGQLMIERNPEDLIKQYEESTLEDVFLKLCESIRNDGDQETSFNEVITEKHIRSQNGSDSNAPVLNKLNAMKFENGNDCSMDEGNNLRDNRIALLSQQSSVPTECYHESFSNTTCGTRLFYLTRKNFLRLKRNVFVTVFTMSLAAVQIAIFFLCISEDPFDLQVAVVNEDQGLNKYGERFLDTMNNHTFYQKQFDNFTLAHESLQKGESWAVMYFGPDFSTCVTDRLLEGIDASNETLQCSTITVVVDVSNYVISGMIRSGLLTSYGKFANELLMSLGLNPSFGQMPVKIEEYTPGFQAASFTEYGSPGIVIGAGYVIQLGLTQMALIREKKQGLLSRAVVAGATTTEILLSFFFSLLMLFFLQSSLVLVIIFFVFSTPCYGPIFWVVVALMVTGICGMSYGFLISCMTDDENAAALIGFGSVFPTLILSGMFWPMEAMPYYMRYFCYSLPLTRIIGSLRFIMSRGWGITHNLVWDGYLICSGWVVVHMTLSIILLKIRK